MKKRFALLMAFAMLVSMTRCGGKTAPGTETEPRTSEAAESVSAESTKEVPSTAEPTQVVQGGDTETAEKSPYLHVILDSCYTTVSDPETYQQKLYVEYVRMSLTEEDAARYPELAAEFAAYNQQEQERNEKISRELETAYEEVYANGNEYDEVLYSSIKGSVLRADSGAVSIYHCYEGYWGGPHGDYSYSALNYDTQTGKKLKFSDVVKDTGHFWELADVRMQQSYGDIYDELIKVQDYAADLDSEMEDMLCWSLDYEGVTVYFNPYALGSYAMGAQSVKICFDEAPEMFNEAYIVDMEDYVSAIPKGHMISIDANGDGQRESLMIEERYPEGYDQDGYRIWNVQVGTKSLKLEDWCYSQESYLIRTKGQYYLYMFERSDNDYVIHQVIDLKTMDRKENSDRSVNLSVLSWDWKESGDGVSETIRSSLEFTDPTAFQMDTSLEILGTHSGKMWFEVGENGLPKSRQESYDLTGNTILETRREVACKTVTAEGSIIGETVIPKGTCLYFIRTDGDTWVDMQIIDSSKVSRTGEDDYQLLYTEEAPQPDVSAEIYRIEVNTENYPRTVNGVEEGEVFAGLLYAG